MKQFIAALIFGFWGDSLIFCSHNLCDMATFCFRIDFNVYVILGIICDLFVLLLWYYTGKPGKVNG